MNILWFCLIINSKYIVVLFFAEDDNDISGSLKLMLENFIQQLPNCVNRELIDKVCALT